MRFRSIAALCLVLSAGSASCAPGDDAPGRTAEKPAAVRLADAAAPAGPWHRWRGPNVDGVSTETGWKAWGEDGPTRLWKAEVGTGFSSVSVAGKQVFTMGHINGQDVVWCLDAETGKPLWEHRYECELVDNLHEGGPACTPTVDGDRVYTVSKEGHFFCLDRSSGQPVWQVDLQAELGVAMPAWGFSCSPLVLGELVIVEAGRLAALEKTTGKVVWQSDKFRPGYGSPIAFEADGRIVVATLNNDCLLVADAADGRQLDSQPWVTDYATSASTPVISGRTIFISTGYNRGCALYELREGKLHEVYENRNMRNHMNSCVLHEAALYGFDGNSHSSRNVSLVALDHASGDVLWEQRGLGCGSLMIADGKLILLGDDGELAIARASREGYQELARGRVLDGRCWTPPVLAGGRIYCRNAAGELVCIDVAE